MQGGLLDGCREPDTLLLHPADVECVKRARREINARWDQLKQQYRDNFHLHQDAAFELVAPTLRIALRDRDLNSFWSLFASTLEHSVIGFTEGYADTDWHKYVGRGSVKPKLYTHRPNLKGDGERHLTQDEPSWSSSLIAQSNRCHYLATMLSKYAFLLRTQPHPDDKHAMDIARTLQCTRDACIQYLDWQITNCKYFDPRLNPLLHDCNGNSHQLPQPQWSQAALS